MARELLMCVDSPVSAPCVHDTPCVINTPLGELKQLSRIRRVSAFPFEVRPAP